MTRDERQKTVMEWVRATFGAGIASSRPERAARFLEEAIELAQADGMDRKTAERILGHVYAKPVGNIANEVGGVGVTLLAYCAAAGVSAEDEERKEVATLLAKDAEYYRKRHAAKVAAGVASG